MKKGNEKEFKLGLCGCGNRTRALIDSLRYDHFYRITAAFDINRNATQNLIHDYGGKACASLEELKNEPETDAYLISLSPFAHADALRKLIPTGKPIFVEKPVAFTGSEILELKQLADQYHTPVQVGFMRRYLPEVINTLNYIRENKTGHIFSVDCNWFHHGATEMNHCLWHKPDDFRLKVSQIPFHCCHMLDVMLLMAGPVQRVTSLYTKVIDRPYPSPDDVIAHFEYADGANGNFHYSSMVYYTLIAYRFHCENYSIQLNQGDEALKIYHRPRFRSSELAFKPDEKILPRDFNARYEEFCRPEVHTFEMNKLNIATENIMFDFVRTVHDGMQPAADLATAVRVQGLAEAIEQSGKLGKTIELNPDGIPVKD